MIGVMVEDTQLASLANIFCCKAGSLPSFYVCFPLCVGVASKALRSLVIERMEKRLSLWKADYLSLGGRITLIKVVLANLPIYFMSMFRCPLEVNKRIEKLQRDILWHGTGKKKSHLIKWSQVCKPKKEGGMGIRPPKEMNLAHLGKWLWRIGDDSWFMEASHFLEI